MTSQSSSSRTARGFQITPGVVRRLIQIAAMLLIQALALFLPAGKLDWWQGWAYVGMYVFYIALNSTIMVSRGEAGAALIEERGRATKLRTWDRAVLAVYSLSGLVILIVGGLSERLGAHWGLPLAVQVAGFAVMMLGYGVFAWAMAANAYFAAAVRIQDDRGHRVVDTGPYRIVRHPGYMGVVWFALATPFFLNSVWVWLPALCLVGAVATRAALEDRTLQEELAGYRAYAQRVRHRLIPGIW